MARQTIHIQYVGSVPAVPLHTIQPGDVLMWNAGVTSEIVSIEPKGKQSLILTERMSDGHEWTRTKRASSLVARVRARRCQSCGTRREPHDQYCANCGTRIAA